jgi:hypothetical protein
MWSAERSINERTTIEARGLTRKLDAEEAGNVEGG